ncbi:myo-inosose-2 dehydratase [Caproicibacter fermentans]|uniref:Inosose dehydratase n=1 Tax=Caproicibacter fermentans TaxID=2576756 RepID=A0A7G8TDR6_9FIRM|nr:myo-inosose-2 dehydratase [Caproicibacter fermentans]QNK41757.1 myo-inosose-2 dehydratase [Caproicibacter fermentans]
MLDSKKVSLGIAPIGWTNDDMPDLGKENTFEQCVSEMALAGYAGCEIGNKFPADREVLKRALDLRGLTVCNQWFSTFLISRPFEETAGPFEEKLDTLKYLGAKVIGVSEQSYSIQGKKQPIFEGKHVMDDREWNLLCEGLNRLGKIANDRQMKLTFHHHMGTVVQDEKEIDRLMAHTDPDMVYLLFDSGHLSFCGIDPEKILNRYVSRVGHVHLKDLRSSVAAEAKAKRLSFLDGVRGGTFTVPGDGDVDFKPIFEILGGRGYEGWVVVEAEQDPAKANPFEYAKKARAYIRAAAGI